MRVVVRCLITAMSISPCLIAADFESDRINNWHHWRGPDANGVSTTTESPVMWSESTNIRWKVPIPGAGSSTPVVWGDRMFLTTAIDTAKKPDQPIERGAESGFRIPGLSTQRPETVFQYVVMCMDHETGEMLWQKTVGEAVPHAGHHPTHGYASASATTDGQSVYVSFGSRGLYCLDLEGNVRWQKSLGEMETKLGFGEGTSPVVHEDSLIMNWDHEGQSFITRLNAKSGEEIWRVNRDEGTTWATPLVVARDSQTQIVVNGTVRTRSYDFDTGELIWECGGQAGNPIPMPLLYRDSVLCMTGFRGFALFSIPLNSRGDLTGSDRLTWSQNQNAPYVASAVIYKDLLYYTKERNGILYCVDAATGEPKYEAQRLPDAGTLYSSLAAADDKIYISNRNGTTFVVAHGPEFKLLSTNELDEPIDASPVFVGDRLFLRGKNHLYCIEQ